MLCLVMSAIGFIFARKVRKEKMLWQ